MSERSAVETIAAAIGEVELRGIVERITGMAEPRIADWRYERLAVINGWDEYRGLFRFAGEAQVAGQRRAWSVILKVIRRPPRSSDDPAQPHFWKREALAYGSPLLSGGPGLRPVRCLGVDPRDDDTFTLWLEDLKDEYPEGWPLERYRLAAVHLGEMSGAHLSRDRSLDPPWLMRRGFATELEGAGARAMEALISDAATWEHPQVRRAFPESTARRVAEQWEHRSAFHAIVSELPTTICHNDAHAHNLFSRRREDGSQETIALDWELMGIGTLTADITYLVIGSLRRFAVDITQADDLEAVVLDGYMDGLERAGFRGDRAAIRLGYTATVALRLGLVPQTLGLIMSGSQRARQERAWRRPADELIARWVQVADFVLDRVRLARELSAVR